MTTGRLAGIITDGDLRRAIQKLDQASLANLKCDEIMTQQSDRGKLRTACLRRAAVDGRSTFADFGVAGVDA